MKQRTQQWLAGLLLLAVCLGILMYSVGPTRMLSDLSAIGNTVLDYTYRPAVSAYERYMDGDNVIPDADAGSNGGLNAPAATSGSKS